MLEPGREVWVTFTGDPKGPDSLTKGACSEAQDGVGGGRSAGPDTWVERDPWTVYTGAQTQAVTHSPTLPSAAGR